MIKMFIYQIQVDVEEASVTDWSAKYCQAQDDPHFFTFDGRYFIRVESIDIPMK